MSGKSFGGTLTTQHGAALEVSCSYATAKRWQQEFIRKVARNFKCDSLIES